MASETISRRTAVGTSRSTGPCLKCSLLGAQRTLIGPDANSLGRE